MSIAHELSCDVAAAMLAGNGHYGRADRGQTELSEIVLEVHLTLRRLTREARVERLDSRLGGRRARGAPAAGGHSPSGH